MTNYDDIKLEIFEAYENGEISEDDKDELLMEAYSLEYDEEDEDSFTLEEAMDYIDDYLTEGFLNKKSKGSRISAKDRTRNMIDSDRSERWAEDNEKPIILDSNIGKISYINKLKDNITKYKFELSKLEKFDDSTPELRHIKNQAIKRNKQLLNRDLAKLKKAKDDAKKAGVKLESVDDLRLRVYEAYEEGVISEYDKDTFLEYLDLENYE